MNVQFENGSTSEAYETPCAHFYIELSPSERLYFSDLIQDDWESDAKFAERAKARCAEIEAALRKYVAALPEPEMTINRAVSLGLLD